MSILSMLDTDHYKMTTGQAILEKYPSAWAKYNFINRGGHKFTPEFYDKLMGAIENMAKLKLREEERKWYQTKNPYLKPGYIEFLKNYRYDPRQVKVELSENGDLKVEIEGLWHQTVYWEVPILALISECYFNTIDTKWKDLNIDYRLIALDKLRVFVTNDLHVTEFGTRRRRDSDTQNTFLETAVLYGGLSGTSNPYFAMKHNMRVVGTFPHEWVMAIAILEGLRHANRYALRKWSEVYNADLGIALTDTYGLDAFLADFDMTLAKLFDGVRHDSGSPFEFVDKIVKHYQSLKINPLFKVALFSDNLDPKLACEIAKYCIGKIIASFGIGTNLTNDFSICNSKALNMVIKLCEIDHIPVVKLGEDPIKACGDRDALRVANWVVHGKPLDK